MYIASAPSCSVPAVQRSWRLLLMHRGSSADLWIMQRGSSGDLWQNSVLRLSVASSIVASLSLLCVAMLPPTVITADSAAVAMPPATAVTMYSAAVAMPPAMLRCSQRRLSQWILLRCRCCDAPSDGCHNGFGCGGDAILSILVAAQDVLIQGVTMHSAAFVNRAHAPSMFPKKSCR